MAVRRRRRHRPPLPRDAHPRARPGGRGGRRPGGDAGRGRRGAAARAHAARRRHRRPRPRRTVAGRRDRPARLGRHRPAERRPPARARADDAGRERPRAGRAGAVRPAAARGAPADALRRPACADGREPARLGGVRRALGHDLLARHREPDRDAPGRDPAHERAAAHLPAGLPRAEPRRLHRRRGGAGLPARPLRHDPPSPRVLRRRASCRRRGGIGRCRKPRVPRLLGGRSSGPPAGCGPDPCLAAVPGGARLPRGRRQPRHDREHAPGAPRGEPGAVRRLLPVRRSGDDRLERRDGRPHVAPRRPGRVRRAPPAPRVRARLLRRPAGHRVPRAPACGGADARRRARGQRRRRPARGRR